MDQLSRFHDAQKRHYAGALAELKDGCKRSHWMWFIFPQIHGLGASSMSQHYAIADLSEAQEYLRDPVFGARLRECIAAVLGHRNATARAIFGYPDDLKFCSCLTLFELADPTEKLFKEALNAFYEGSRDSKTILRANKQ